MPPFQNVLRASECLSGALGSGKMTFHVTPIFFRRGSPGYDEYGRLPPKNGGRHMKSHAASGAAFFFFLSGHKKINWNSIIIDV